MNFLEKIFGESIWWSKPEAYMAPPKRKAFVVNRRKFKTVPKWTHPGKQGKTVYCPKCGSPSHVYHFSWSALTCGTCKANIKKYEWLLIRNP